MKTILRAISIMMLRVYKDAERRRGPRPPNGDFNAALLTSMYLFFFLAGIFMSIVGIGHRTSRWQVSFPTKLSPVSVLLMGAFVYGFVYLIFVTKGRYHRWAAEYIRLHPWVEHKTWPIETMIVAIALATLVIGGVLMWGAGSGNI